MVKDVTPSDIDVEKKSTKLLFVDCWAPWCAPCTALVPIFNEVPVIVDFWAPWCGPCKMIAPTLDKIAKEFAGKVIVAKVNTDDHRDFSRDNMIHGIPCVLIFMDGEPAKLEIPSEDGTVSVVDRLVGLRPAEHYEYAINKLLNRDV